MGLWERLLRLDERVLPRLARGLGRIHDVRRDVPRPRALVVIAAILALAVVAVIVWDRGPTGGQDGLGDAVRVGPRDGDSIPEYLQASREELDRLAAAAATVPGEPVYALVTLAIYASPERVASLFRAHPDLTTWLAFARVPLPRRQTQRVQLAAERLPADLLASMTLVAGTKADEAARATRLALSESSPDRRVLYESLADLASAEASAYRQPCACVFALVVRGTPAALAALAAQADVRGIDPAPEVTQLGRAVFMAPLPDQLDRVQPPIDDDALIPRGVATRSGR